MSHAIRHVPRFDPTAAADPESPVCVLDWEADEPFDRLRSHIASVQAANRVAVACRLPQQRLAALLSGPDANRPLQVLSEAYCKELLLYRLDSDPAALEGAAFRVRPLGMHITLLEDSDDEGNASDLLYETSSANLHLGERLSALAAEPTCTRPIPSPRTRWLVREPDANLPINPPGRIQGWLWARP